MQHTLLMKSVFTVITAMVLPVLAQAGQPESPMTPVPRTSLALPWNISMEALYLKARSGGGGYRDQNEEFGYRASLSFKSGDNLGLRLRYFDFDGTDGAVQGGPYLTPEWSTLDCEVFDDFELGDWRGEYAAGLRYYSYDESANPGGFGSDGGAESDGWGPIFGLDMTHPIVGSLAFYANTRASILFGRNDNGNGDDLPFVVESGLGLQYTFAVGAAESFVRLGVDAQIWSDVTDYIPGDVGLVGAALKIGFTAVPREGITCSEKAGWC